MQPLRRSLPRLRIAGLARRQSNDRPDRIGAQWQAFYAAGGPAQIAGRASDDVYALYTDYEGDHTRPYTMVIGCALADDAPAPDGLVVKELPAADYAVFDASGPQPQSVVAAWRRIWEAPIARRFAADFDHYRADGGVEIFVGVA